MANNEDIYAGFADAYRTALTTPLATPFSTNLALRFERFCPFGGEADGGKYHNLVKEEGKASSGTGDKGTGDTPKFAWLKQFDGKKAGCEAQLAQAHARRARLCEAINGQMFELELDWRFLTGSGNPHPIENGLTWHPTLGVPYLPASAFKGLLRAFLTHWQGDAATLGKELFGDTDAAGQLQFFDVLPSEPVKLLVDVMTPHYGEWYVAGGDAATALAVQNIPAPWHNPVPIPFLVVQGPLTLRAMVAPLRGVQKQSLWDELETLIVEAFSVAGAGAKTASGYGRMALARGHVACAQARAQDAAEEAQVAARLKQQQDDEAKKQQDEDDRVAKKAARDALPKAAKAQELLTVVLAKGNGRAIAGYLCGKNFKRDRDEWDLSVEDMKAAFHQDAAMRAHIKQWAGKKGDEGEAYEVFKLPKQS